MIKRLLKCVREYKVPTFITLVLMVFEAMIECLIPLIVAKMVDFYDKHPDGIDDMSVIYGYGALLIGMALVSLTCGGLGGFTCSKASSGFAKNLRHDIYEKIQTYSFENIDKFSSASLVTRLTTDVGNVQMAFMMIIRTAIRSPLMFIFSIIMAFSYGGQLAWTFVVIIPVLLCGLLLIARKAMPAFRRVFKKYDKLNESIEENVRGMRVVKGFSREEYEKQKFDANAVDICNDFTRAERIVALNTPVMQICLYFNMVFVLTVGSMMIVNNNIAGIESELGVGAISMMLTYGMSVLMALMMLSMIYVMLTMSAESMKRIYEVLSEDSALTSPENAVCEVKDGSIDFDGVSFKYSKRAKKNALSNVDLHISSGMTVGILGGTGSSKTTLVQLIPRLYDVSEGSVKVGGVDVREYDLEMLRQSVAMVLQKNLLFAGTIKENLRWGDPDATDEQIIEACRLACADEFVENFPDKYDTMIEQGGTNVSGGQKQRLCIARALLKKPKILILDDSTSAVDTKTDSMIRQGFKKFIPETTKIIIAQRVASVEDADLILVMENGEIVARGSHEELLSGCDIYREIYEQQTGGHGDE